MHITKSKIKTWKESDSSKSVKNDKSASNQVSTKSSECYSCPSKFVWRFISRLCFRLSSPFSINFKFQWLMIAVVVQKDHFLEGQRHIIVLLSDLIFSLFFADPLWKKSQGKKRLALICFFGGRRTWPLLCSTKIWPEAL